MRPWSGAAVAQGYHAYYSAQRASQVSLSLDPLRRASVSRGLTPCAAPTRGAESEKDHD